jgi:hypothetical protein
MTVYSIATRLVTATALSLGLLLAGSIATAADAPPATQPSTPPTAPAYGPGMMAPGMMDNMTPEQRQQHLEQMRQSGYGPGMMGQGQGMMGQGVGTMMGAPASTPPASPGK